MGAGASAGNNVSVGPLLVNSGNIDSILNGWSISAAANLPFPPAAGIGWQVITNGSGTAQGLTAGVPGVSVDVTYAVCTNR